MTRLKRWIARVIAERPDPDQQQLLHRYAVWHVLRRLRGRLGRHARHPRPGRRRPAEHQGRHRPARLAHRPRPHPGHRPARRPGGMAGQRRRPPTARDAGQLRPLGQQAEADQPGLPGHPMGRPDRRDRHRDPLGTSPLAAPRRHPQTRGPRRRAARPPLRPVPGHDQPPHPRPRRDQRRPGAASGSAASRSSSPNRSTPWSCELVATRHGHAAIGDQGTSPWLFPGGQPGQPISAYQLAERLRQLGIRPGQSRSAALFQLATDLPAAVLARMLGIHITVAVAWQRACRRRLDRLRRRLQPPNHSREARHSDSCDI